MKRKLLIIYLTLTCICSSQAQISSQINTPAGVLDVAHDNSIVRNYNSVHVVGFVSGTTSGTQHAYFYTAIANSGNTTFGNSLWLETPKDWRVKDMHIDEDYIYFCGIDSINRILIGRFSFSALASAGTPSIEYYFLPLNDSLDRITVVKNSTSNDIAMAIGTKIVATCDFTSSTVRYVYLPFNKKEETAYDIIQNNDTLYIWGTDIKNNALTLRKCDASLLLSDPMFDTVRRFTPPNNKVSPHGCRVTMMPDGNMAIVHQSVLSYIYIDFVVFSPSASSILNRQTYVCNDRLSLRDICYMPVSQSLVVLYRDNSTSYTPIIEWMPYITTIYSANMLMPPIQLHSLDRLTFDNFIAMGGKQWFVQRTPYSAWQNSCMPLVAATIEPSGIGTRTLIYHYLTKYIASPTINIFNGYVQEFSTINSCIQ